MENLNGSDIMSSKILDCVIYWQMAENCSDNNLYAEYFENHNKLFNQIAESIGNDNADEIIYYFMDNYMFVTKHSSNFIN